MNDGNAKRMRSDRLLLAAMCAGLARWEPYRGTSVGEICVGGLRFSASLDEDGCPDVGVLIRSSLIRAFSEEA